MGKMKIEFINQGFIDILSSEGTKSLIEEKTAEIKERAGEDFSSSVKKGFRGTRWVGFVGSRNHRGAREEAEHKVLSRAIR